MCHISGPLSSLSGGVGVGGGGSIYWNGEKTNRGTEKWGWNGARCLHVAQEQLKRLCFKWFRAIIKYLLRWKIHVWHIYELIAGATSHLLPVSRVQSEKHDRFCQFRFRKTAVLLIKPLIRAAIYILYMISTFTGTNKKLDWMDLRLNCTKQFEVPVRYQNVDAALITPRYHKQRETFDYLSCKK